MFAVNGTAHPRNYPPPDNSGTPFGKSSPVVTGETTQKCWNVVDSVQEVRPCETFIFWNFGCLKHFSVWRSILCSLAVLRSSTALNFTLIGATSYVSPTRGVKTSKSPPPDKRHYPHLQCTHADDEKGCLTFRGTCLLAIVQPWRVVLSPCDNELSVWRNDWLTKGIDGDVYRQCKLNKCSRIYSKTYQRHNVVHTIVKERKAMKS